MQIFQVFPNIPGQMFANWIHLYKEKTHQFLNILMVYMSNSIIFKEKDLHLRVGELLLKERYLFQI